MLVIHDQTASKPIHKKGSPTISITNMNSIHLEISWSSKATQSSMLHKGKDDQITLS